MKDLKNSGFTAKFLPSMPVPENPFFDHNFKDKKDKALYKPETSETDEQRLDAKPLRFGVYIRSRELYNFRSPQKDEMSKAITESLKKRLDALENMYPDFPQAFNDYVKDKKEQ